MADYDETIIPSEPPAERPGERRGGETAPGAFGADALGDGPDDGQVQTIAQALVSRYRQQRAEGHDVTIDELVESASDSCDRDTLRSSMMQLLAEGATVSGAVGGSGSEPTRPRTAGEDAPLPKVEGYTLRRCLGRGGMGAVYEGIQDATGRRVAVKFMLDAVSASESARKRFEREVEVVARLQHPGIVSIVDSGVRRGRYFYVMEYVQGKPLDGAIERGSADLRRTLEVVARICDAVDAAHQRGILHRDLKPANIIIDDDDQPHLFDFGLAKTFDPDVGNGEAHGRMGLTVSGPGQLLGTVAYMSPEQAQGKHDETSVRTDVYALGAITYESVTGRLPCIVQGSLHDVLARIIGEDPPAPSTLRAGASRDLDAVILRALEKSPQRRYATVAEFAAELRRVLAGEPVTARRISAAGRGWRWVRRNRGISTTAAVALATLVIVSALLVTRIVQESRIAAFERDVARENFDRLRTILESADPERSPGGATVMQLLDAASRALDEAPPERELAEAQIREVLGSVYRKLGEYGKAQIHQARVLEVREGTARGRNDPQLADALHNLAATLWWDGNYDLAEAHYARALRIRRGLHPGDHPTVATGLTHLAACRLRMGKLEEAQAMYEEALAMRRRMYGREHEEVAQALNNLAKCMLDADQFRRAEVLHREALEMIKRLRGDLFVGTAAASQNLAECLLRRSVADAIAGDLAGAAEAAQAARDASELALNIRTATFPSGHHLIAASLSGLARAELKLDNVDRAAVLTEEALDMVRQTRRPDHPDFVGVLQVKALVQLANGDPVASAESLDQAITIASEIRPPADLQIAQLRGELGMALAAIARADEMADERLLEAAESLLVESLTKTRALRGDASVDAAFAARTLIGFYHECGEIEKATPYLSLARLVDDGPR